MDATLMVAAAVTARKNLKISSGLLLASVAFSAGSIAITMGSWRTLVILAVEAVIFWPPDI